MQCCLYNPHCSKMASRCFQGHGTKKKCNLWRTVSNGATAIPRTKMVPIQSRRSNYAGLWESNSHVLHPVQLSKGKKYFSMRGMGKEEFLFPISENCSRYLLVRRDLRYHGWTTWLSKDCSQAHFFVLHGPVTLRVTSKPP